MNIDNTPNNENQSDQTDSIDINQDMNQQDDKTQNQDENEQNNDEQTNDDDKIIINNNQDVLNQNNNINNNLTPEEVSRRARIEVRNFIRPFAMERHGIANLSLYTRVLPSIRIPWEEEIAREMIADGKEVPGWDRWKGSSKVE